MNVTFSGIGKHVSVQPPAALGQNETLRMVQAAQYYPALLSVNKNGMLRHLLGGAVVFISLQHFVLPDLTYCPA